MRSGLTRRMVSIATGFDSNITLNDGRTMPLFGLGVYMSKDTEKVALQAIKEGYRLIDTAEYYENEAAVGDAVRKCGLPRDQLFVVSKLWDNGRDVCKRHFKASFDKLNIGYIDLYLIHSPLGGHNVETYKTMMEFQKKGMIKSIGVSNFGVQHLEGFKEAGLPTPAVNQIELHPWQRKSDIVKYCRENGIVVMGYSPLSKGQNLGDPKLLDIAKRLSKSPAQVMIRWSVQNGYITIPKTSSLERLSENAAVFDWTIPDQEMDILNAMPQKGCTWNPCDSPWEG